ncbi:type II toxin-antitoxin system VapC family toxin [Leptospira meyeri]|uniref:type II toxin-antitoxin system VapC family toxin n=1 Tax=Leptospira meyeri TaxID=29508 RepID=UPI000C2A65B8|nr:type II toxin-antitoxin system VapC family toxin [Leptospira meyeri]PKA26043.1 VapC toxin family PIN domain ribonuclease [Leptospira sp. mixed culture ATI2-C-A1]MCW7488055.1 type II toxin-antitoxin system VapC family toxin [Leptospira meyeri]PJZ81634.1 VapC toxin family PIN domain ribonuclease [Leptospira meyeri]PJZ97136.1 VapC toxin family PIN domain ribonuclease [Leptospira meyeri]PKA11283.1 VapC toxin family PIN domain ribonuclease [Leptospira meyeri]
MNVVDSSGWLEYFSGTNRANLFAEAIEKTETLIVPSLSLFEIFKKVYKEKGEDLALKIVAHMQLGTVVNLDSRISIYAAKISVEKSIPMADSIIYATAQLSKAILWTQDHDFRGLQGVKFFEKKN